MYLGLQQKPFYFLTDRDTDYQYLVDNRNTKSPKKHLYYPDEYEKMSAKSIQTLKNNSVSRLLWWAVFNQDKLNFNDRKVVNSILVNTAIMLGVCIFGGKSLRKLLFRNEMPVLQIKLERIGFNVRILKTLFSYSIFGAIAYKFFTSELKQTYMIDLAYEYKYYFAEKMHSKTDSLYEQMWIQRINRQNKADLVV